MGTHLRGPKCDFERKNPEDFLFKEFLKGPVSGESDNTCETVGHFCLTGERVAESESDREIRSIFGDYISFTKHKIK